MQSPGSPASGRTRRLRPLTALAVLALLLGLAACGTDDPGDDSAPTPSTPTVTTTRTVTATPTPTPSSSAETSESPTAGTGGTSPATPAPVALLLPASGLPGFTPGWAWLVVSTGPQHGPLGVCQRFPMDTVGADTTLVRSYRPAGDLGGGTGTHLVSRFVDDTSADQAVAVLLTWHDRCGERLARYGFKRVGPVTSVRTDEGSATRYLVSYARKGADEGTFESLGVLRSGSTVQVLRLTLLGQDYPAPDPMVRALQNAAARLG